MDMHELNREELLAAFKNGDEQAINQIYKLYYRPLCYFARGFTNDKEEAEDIVVDTFIKILHKKNDFKSLSDLQGFLYTATRNACLNFIKHVQRKTASHKEIIYLLQNDTDAINTRIIKAEVLKMIMDELEHLPPARREICKLLFINGLSTLQVAEKLGITVDTVRVQKARAIHSLRSFLLKNDLLSITALCLLYELAG
jgi:RNA polymerase sigma-70 factor (family 1)